MAFRKKYPLLLRMKPDVLVIQECENIERLQPFLEKISYNNILWYGNNQNKGVAILSFNDCLIDVKKDFNPEYEYILPLTLACNHTTTNLFCIWAMPHKTERSKNYIGQVWGAINHYSVMLKEPSILIGDFNSNAFWDDLHKNGNHSDVVKFLKDKNINSLYHSQFKVKHGDEIDPTFFLVKNREKPYHLDYCFASEGLISRRTKIQVGTYKDWIKLSDHVPIVVENLNLDF